MKLVIVGGVAGGASAATRARRLSEESEIVVFERGPDVSFANCGLPYYVGGEIVDRKKLLVTTPERLVARFRLDVRIRTAVEAVDRSAKTVRARELASGRVYEEPYDKLILAPAPRRCDRRSRASTCRESTRSAIWRTSTASRRGWTTASNGRSWWAPASSVWNSSRASRVAASPSRSSNCKIRCCLPSTRR